MKLQTEVDIRRSHFEIGYGDNIFMLGSCFTDNIGKKLKDYGFNVCVNPFGTLYNPASVCSSAQSLKSGTLFTPEDVVKMGSGSDMYCSFFHHTLAAAPSPDEFLEKANARLEEASTFWKKSDVVIITLGTSWCYRHIERDLIVSNCLKRPAAEFERVFMDMNRTYLLLKSMLDDNPEKKFVFTVSPIRHLKDTAHGNQLSKSSLLLAIDRVIEQRSDWTAVANKMEVSADANKAEYFPSYEIMMDELRDYRFYAEDMVHPSGQAVQYIFDRFIDWALPDGERELFNTRRKEFLRSQHRSLTL